MKIYQTTVSFVNYFPAIDTLVPEVVDPIDDIRLTVDIDEAELTHKMISSLYEDEDMFYVTNVDKQSNRSNDELHICTTIEWAPPTDEMSKIVIETITREI